MKHTPTFSAGIPTEPDVNRLVEVFGTPIQGTVISYQEIEKIIQAKRGDNRFRSVTSAWRRRLFRTHNLLIGTRPNIGFVCLDNSARVVFSSTKNKSGMRFIRRAGTVAGLTEAEGLTPELLKARDHLVRVASAITLAAATEAKRLKA